MAALVRPFPSISYRVSSESAPVPVTLWNYSNRADLTVQRRAGPRCRREARPTIGLARKPRSGQDLGFVRPSHFVVRLDGPGHRLRISVSPKCIPFVVMPIDPSRATLTLLYILGTRACSGPGYIWDLVFPGPVSSRWHGLAGRAGSVAPRRTSYFTVETPTGRHWFRR